MASRRAPKLGQNFLVDEAACERIAASLGDLRTRTVVEIGPGHGAITGLLAPRCARLHLVEYDPALARELTFRFRNDAHVTVHHADVLAFDFAALERPAGEQLDVIGNLPYYITSDILLHLFAAARAGLIRMAAVMMQREVADRVSAAPGSSEYGALSAFTQLHAQVDALFTLPPEAFRPPPAVFSTVLRLRFAPQFAALGVDPLRFNAFLRASFAQKRKTLANNLRNAGFSAAAIEAAWPAELPAQARAEAVTLPALAELYRALSAEDADGASFASAE